MKTYFRLLSYGRPYSRYALPYLVCTILHTIFNTFTYVMLFPIIETMFNPSEMMSHVTAAPEFAFSAEYLQHLVNYWLYKVVGSEYNVKDMLVILSLLTVCIVFLSNLFRYLSQRIMENLRIHTLESLRNTVFDKVIRLQASFFTSQRKGDIISKITSDVQVVQFCITNTLQIMIKEPLLITGYLIVLITISPSLTLFTVLVLPVIALTIGYIVKKLRRKATEGQEAFGELVATLDESLGSIKTVKGYNATDYVADKFKSQNAFYSKIQRHIAARQQLASPTSETLGVGSLCIILVYGGSMILSGELAAAAFFTYLAIFSQVTRPARAIADAFGNINQGIAAGERVLALADTEIEIKDKENAEELREFNKEIAFENVSFSYEEKEILHNISFSIPKGQTVALVGPSGGGKSTISDLIPRFYDPQKGMVTIDGKDSQDYTLESIRAKMGIVAQETILFNDTIEGNIRMGNETATRDEVKEAARVAGALEFIEATESGFDTNIGDRGVKLSGGQRQRLSIARAVLRNPEILILDEATSALDTQSERIVQASLVELLKGRTSLVIAHRLSTIIGANKIIVIDQGNIVESGTHSELVEKKGLYNKLLEMQQLK
ncbi:MAG: ABC transporter ATP-binding protein [Rikenellaceae bacterium]